MTRLFPRCSRVLATLFLIFTCISTANAECYLDPAWTMRTVTMDIGRLNVPPSAKVGDVLLKKTFNPFTSHQIVFNCGANSFIIFRLTKNYGLAPGFQDVYTTDIPGIGVRLSWFTGGMQSIPYNLPFNGWDWAYDSSVSSSIEIIKTSNQTGSGSLAAGVYAEQFGNGDNKVAVRLMLGGGTSSVIATPACTVPDGSKFVSVPLGSR